MNTIPAGIPPEHLRHDAPDAENVTHVEVSTPLGGSWRSFAHAVPQLPLRYYLNATTTPTTLPPWPSSLRATRSASGLASVRPGRPALRPFGRIATAIRDSQDDLRRWVYNQPLRAGALIAAGYGIAVGSGKHLVIVAVHAVVESLAVL